MRALLIVQFAILVQTFAQISSSCDCVEIDVLVLHAAPQPLNEDVVVATAASVRADVRAGLRQHAAAIAVGEFAALM